MELDLVRADVRMAEHRARVAVVDRFGPLWSAREASATMCRKPMEAITVVLAVPVAVAAALRRAGAQLRGSLHSTAFGGFGQSGE